MISVHISQEVHISLEHTGHEDVFESNGRLSAPDPTHKTGNKRQIDTVAIMMIIIIFFMYYYNYCFHYYSQYYYYYYFYHHNVTFILIYCVWIYHHYLHIRFRGWIRCMQAYTFCGNQRLVKGGPPRSSTCLLECLSLNFPQYQAMFLILYLLSLYIFFVLD